MAPGTSLHSPPRMAWGPDASARSLKQRLMEKVGGTAERRSEGCAGRGLQSAGGAALAVGQEVSQGVQAWTPGPDAYPELGTARGLVAVCGNQFGAY